MPSAPSTPEPPFRELLAGPQDGSPRRGAHLLLLDFPVGGSRRKDIRAGGGFREGGYDRALSLAGFPISPSPCHRVQRHPFERIATPFQVYSWTAPQAEHAMDCVRAEDAYTSRLGYEEHIPGQVPAAWPCLPRALLSSPLLGARLGSVCLPGGSIYLSVLFTWEPVRLSTGRWRKGRPQRVLGLGLSRHLRPFADPGLE